MQINLSGRTVVITGGSSGIGLASAKLFLEAGANTAICGRDKNKLANAAEELAAGRQTRSRSFESVMRYRPPSTSTEPQCRVLDVPGE